MRKDFISRTIFQIFLIIFIGLNLAPAYADIPLDRNSPEFDGDSWIISESGNYYLNFEGEVFTTADDCAIRIRANNVVLDGRGKTISGSGEERLGILVNGGPEMQNITIKNVRIEKKHYGILFEWIRNGRVENCNASGNAYGIYLWNAKSTTVTGNTANNNTLYGIVLDGDDSEYPVIDCINRDNTLVNNTANNNGMAGIELNLESIYNTLTGNTANENGDRGIVLKGNDNYPEMKAPEHNMVSENSVKNNRVGLYLGEKAGNNTIKGNTITGNQDKGIWFHSSNYNTIYNNYFSNVNIYDIEISVGFDGSNTGNQFNTSQTAGVNIVGGPFLGGNFWAKPDGTGFSQVTGDSNEDGICDTAYNLPGGNVDQLPLHTYTQTITVPTVITSAIDLTCDRASGGGNVTSNGGSAVTARGVCWSPTQNPSTGDSHTNDGEGTGDFQSIITGLDLGKSYFARAYATNSAGTNYGDNVQFTTAAFKGSVYVNSSLETCGGCPCYTSIQTAIDAPYSANAIKIAQGTYAEPFLLNDARTITLEGGWDTSFTKQVSSESIIKAPKVNNGCMNLLNVRILP